MSEADFQLLESFKDSFRLPETMFSKSETDFQPVNSFLSGHLSSLAFGSVTSFFGIKGAFFRFSRKQQDKSAPKFFRV